MFAFAKKLVSTIEQSAETIISHPSTEDNYFKSAFPSSFGLRIISVTPNSVSQSLGLESWFDYIIKINYHELPLVPTSDSEFAIDYPLLLREIENNVGRDIKLDVWNAKGGVVRTISIPIEKFNQTQQELEEVSINGDPNHQQIQKGFLNKFGKLGMTVQLTNLQTATYVWHILETHPNSPAYKAGLFPYGDYIIGAQDGLLATGGESLLSKVLTSYYDRSVNKDDVSIVLYVYNHDYDVVRPVTVQLGYSWGGRSLLGCDVGYGYLHRLPQCIGKFVEEAIDKDLVFENSNFISPMDSAKPSLLVPSPPSSSVAVKKKKKRFQNSDNLNEFLNEELEKSRAADGNGAIPPKSSNVPPPPSKTN